MIYFILAGIIIYGLIWFFCFIFVIDNNSNKKGITKREIKEIFMWSGIVVGGIIIVAVIIGLFFFIGWLICQGIASFN
jgi:hypothetical protein